MAERTLEQRVTALEKQMQGKTLQEHFREQAELIDRLFVYRFEEFEKRLDEKWEKRFDEKFEEKFEQKFEEKFEQKFEEKFQPVRAQLNTIEDLVKTVLNRLN